MFTHRLLLTALLLLSINALAAPILVVQSYHGEYDWVKSHTRGLERVLADKHDLVYFEMDTKRVPVERHQHMAELAWQRYQQLSPQLVVLCDDNALKLLAPKLQQTATPAVYLGINANPRDYGIRASNNFYGVLERLLIKRSIVLLKSVTPLNRILVLFDSGTTSTAIFREVFNHQTSQRISGVQIDITTTGDFEQWQRIVADAGKRQYDAILLGLYHNLVDPDGNHVDEDTVITWTSSNASVPPFGLWDYAIGADKAIGGYVISGQQQGILAGKIAQKLINGQSISTMPQTTNSGELRFSQTQLTKWNIRLPATMPGRVTLVD